jgi:hypothetical protein
VNEDQPVRPRRPRWGLRAMAWLTLALVCVMTSNMLHAAGNSDWVLVTFTGTILGILSAGYCSIRGLASAGWLSR